jgi:cytochrome c6
MKQAAWMVVVASALGALAPALASEAFTVEQVARGQQVYNRTCVHCHGRNMVNAGTTTYDLRRFPQDDPERFFNSVNNGVGNMPSWKGRLEDADIQALWAYVATRGGKEL